MQFFFLGTFMLSQLFYWSISYTMLFPDSFCRSFWMVWEILPTKGVFSIDRSEYLDPPFLPLDVQSLQLQRRVILVPWVFFYRRNVILQCRGVAWPREVSDKQMDPVDLPIGSFRFSWFDTVVFFLKSQVVVGYYVDWLSADLHQDSWESWESWGQIWFSSWASINNWTRLDLSSWQGLGCWPG